MSGEQQQTIAREARISGVGLHTGNTTNLVFKPAPVGYGIRFVRVDLPEQPEVPVRADNVVLEDLLRQTAIGTGPAQIMTVEHVLAAVSGLGIDNLRMELDANEPPIADGSAQPFVDTLLAAGIVAQEAPRQYFEVTKPVVLLENGGVELVAIPSPRLEITFKIEYDHPAVGICAASFLITPEIFQKEIAPARTFCFYRDIEQIRDAGLIKGGSLENAVVIGEDRVLNDNLRFSDEIVRHKILDIIGDLTLLGRPLKAHIIAVRSGHSYNVRFVRKILETLNGTKTAATASKEAEVVYPISADRIQGILPHRYPFLLVDRIISMDAEQNLAIGLKNVTINEQFFQGHFPGKAVMPGVLLIEAMAQVGGVMLLSKSENRGLLAYLLSIESAKFRRPVVPGDQMRIETQILKVKRRTGKVAAKVLVDGQVAAEAEIMFSLVPYEE